MIATTTTGLARDPRAPSSSPSYAYPDIRSVPSDDVALFRGRSIDYGGLLPLDDKYTDGGKGGGAGRGLPDRDETIDAVLNGRPESSTNASFSFATTTTAMAAADGGKAAPPKMGPGRTMIAIRDDHDATQVPYDKTFQLGLRKIWEEKRRIKELTDDAAEFKRHSLTSRNVGDRYDDDGPRS